MAVDGDVQTDRLEPGDGLLGGGVGRLKPLVGGGDLGVDQLEVELATRSPGERSCTERIKNQGQGIEGSTEDDN